MADPAAGPRPATAAVTGVAAAAGLIAVLTLLSRVAGFARTLVFADAVRTAGVGAVYNTVNAMPNVLYEVAAGGVLAAVAIPVVAGHLGRGDAARANRSASALLTWAFTVLLPLAAVLALAAPALTGWFVDDDQPGAVAVGTTMLRVFAVQVPLYGLGIVLAGVLQAHRRFFAAALAPLLSSLVVMVSYVIYGSVVDGVTAPSDVSHGAVLLLAWGTTLGVVALSVPLVVPAVRAGFRWHPTWRFPPGDARRSASLAGAGLLALLAQQACVLATIWVANHRGDNGTLSVYQYIQAVYLLPYAILAVPVATSAFPALAQAAGAGHDAVPTLGRSVRAVLGLTGIASAVLVAAAGSVGAFFSALDARRGGGQTSTASLAALGDGLAAYAPGVVGFGVVALLTRALYVRGRPRDAALSVALGWLVAAVVPLVVLGDGAGPVRTLRVLGLASAGGMTLAAVLLAVLVRRAWGPQAFAGSGRTLVGVVVGGACGAGVAALLGRAVAADHTAGLLRIVAGGLVVGAVAMVVAGAVLGAVDRSAAGIVLARLARRTRG